MAVAEGRIERNPAALLFAPSAAKRRAKLRDEGGDFRLTGAHGNVVQDILV